MQKTEPYRSASPSTVHEATCEICGCACEIIRNVSGPTSWIGAMNRTATLHDRIRCPHTGKDWHLQALALREAIRATPSPRIAALMQQDLDEVLASRRTP